MRWTGRPIYYAGLLIGPVDRGFLIFGQQFEYVARWQFFRNHSNAFHANRPSGKSGLLEWRLLINAIWWTHYLRKALSRCQMHRVATELWQWAFVERLFTEIRQGKSIPVVCNLARLQDPTDADTTKLSSVPIIGQLLQWAKFCNCTFKGFITEGSISALSDRRGK
jgi:hypothetical protein